jgi:microcystin-dependent protein
MSSPYVGQIMMFGGNFAPAGWAFCNGQLLPISEFDTLFNLIGTTYGGDGETTFAVPDMRGRVPIHMGQGPGVSQNYVIGEQFGVEQVTLTTQQIPIHNHIVLVNSGAAGNSSSPGGNALADEGIGLATATAYSYLAFGGTQSQLAPQAIGQAGGNQPHDNLQSFQTLNYIISLFGVYPSPT